MSRRSSPGMQRLLFPTVYGGAGLPQTLSNLHYAIAKAGYREVHLDFSPCQTIHESGMLPMLPIISHYRATDNVDFSIELPRDSRIRQIFLRSNWAHLIDPFNYPASDSSTDRHFPAFRFSTAEEQFEVVDRVMAIVLTAGDISKDVIKAIEWSVNEITDNVLNHAGKNAPGYIQATYFKENKLVEFVVADAGIGIPRSLRENDDCLALERAVQEGVTRNSSTNQGNGLYGSLNIAMSAGGVFQIHSQFATLYKSQDGDLKIRKAAIPYKGTTVLWNMKVDASNIIEKSFTFKGRTIEPAYGYIDRMVEASDGVVPIALKKNFRSVGSREAGKTVRTYIKNLLSGDGIKRIEVDFTDINIISSSFADEVFGRLFAELGPMNFMSLIAIVNADPEIRALIDRAIIQRSGMKI